MYGNDTMNHFINKSTRLIYVTKPRRIVEYVIFRIIRRVLIDKINYHELFDQPEIPLGLGRRIKISVIYIYNF